MPLALSAPIAVSVPDDRPLSMNINYLIFIEGETGHATMALGGDCYLSVRFRPYNKNIGTH